MKDTIKTRLTNLGSMVVDVLATAGLDKANLTTAMEKVVKNYYDAGALVYKRSSGSGSKDSMINKGNTVMAENRTATKSRIVNTKDKTGKDSNIYQIHFKDFVDDIIAEYNKL